MATVSELKAQARVLEQQGRLSKALAIYQHILKHIEGTPSLLRELPLYVKAGDLQLKLDERESAVDMYERAAEHYASHGSAKSVIALCTKVLRAVPKRTDVYLRFARLMMERQHVAAARDVLLAYAETAKLAKTHDALELLGDRPDAEAVPVLEMLLEAAARDERAATERTAERVSIQLARIRDEPEPPVQAATPSPPEREPEEPEESEEPDEAVSDDADKPDGAAAVRGTPKPVGPGPVGVFDPNKPIATHDDELAGVGGSDLGRRVSGASRASPTDAADARGFEPRVPSRRPAFAPDAEHHGVLIEDDEGGRKSRSWMWGAAATVVVLGGVGLVFSGVMRIGGSESQTASLPVPPARPALPPADNDSAVAPPGAATDTVPSLEGGHDTLVAALGDTGLSVATVDTALRRTPVAIPDSLAAPAPAEALARLRDSAFPNHWLLRR